MDISSYVLLSHEQALQRRLEDGLLAFGEGALGCRGISQVWLSYYVDGMRQVREAA